MKNYCVKDVEDLYKTGIYKITCLSNNKVYIGSACGRSSTPSKKGFIRRWTEHSRKLKEGIHKNKYLQHAYNKYGEDMFIFEILEFCTIEESDIKEKYYIDFYDNLYGIFNILKGSLHNYKEHTKEHNQKIAQALKGKKRPLEIVKKWSNKVQQLDKQGNVVAEYYSMSEAERQTGIMRQDIGQAVIGRKMKKAGGYYWKKVKDIV